MHDYCENCCVFTVVWNYCKTVVSVLVVAASVMLFFEIKKIKDVQ